MASFLNMGEKVRRNSISKTEFRLFPSRTAIKIMVDNIMLYDSTYRSKSVVNIRIREEIQ
jgi:hypothetical protein